MLAVSRRTGEQVLIEDVVLTVELIDPSEVQMTLQKRESVPVVVTLKPSQFVNACYNVRIGVVRVQGDKVRLGFEIPPTVKIARL
jgi:sRNA-binding carbon storage regulator CsrA